MIVPYSVHAVGCRHMAQTAGASVNPLVVELPVGLELIAITVRDFTSGVGEVTTGERTTARADLPVAPVRVLWALLAADDVERVAIDELWDADAVPVAARARKGLRTAYLAAACPETRARAAHRIERQGDARLVEAVVLEGDQESWLAAGRHDALLECTARVAALDPTRTHKGMVAAQHSLFDVPVASRHRDELLAPRVAKEAPDSSNLVRDHRVIRQHEQRLERLLLRVEGLLHDADALALEHTRGAAEQAVCARRAAQLTVPVRAAARGSRLREDGVREELNVVERVVEDVGGAAAVGGAVCQEGRIVPLVRHAHVLLIFRKKVDKGPRGEREGCASHEALRWRGRGRAGAGERTSVC
eukprot:scaffold320561_cov45-Tisochrysis_lutea.AAC.2